jgi:hypothetical protein
MKEIRKPKKQIPVIRLRSTGTGTGTGYLYLKPLNYYKNV